MQNRGSYVVVTSSFFHMEEYMNTFYADDCRVYRKESTIYIETPDGFKKEIILKDINNNTGKINIPLSNLCTLDCIYCSEARYNENNSITISKDVAFQIIDAYFLWINNFPSITEIILSFDYGGEPICKLDLLECISKQFRKKCVENNYKSVVMMTTNCTWNTDLLPRVLESVDEIIVSIDGPKKLHEKYRINKLGNSLFELILKNALAIYKSGKLKQISSVITKDTLLYAKEYAEFFINTFPGCSVKVSAVIVTGNAKTNNVERIQVNEMTKFVELIEKKAQGKIKIIDSKPEKILTYKYVYGCEHMRTTNWFFWLDGKISCCTERNNSNFYIGNIDKNTLNMNFSLMKRLMEENNVENIEKCSECIAKYYCSGGCPEFRKNKINCERRIEKYAKMLTK